MLEIAKILGFSENLLNKESPEYLLHKTELRSIEERPSARCVSNDASLEL